MFKRTETCFEVKYLQLEMLKSSSKRCKIVQLRVLTFVVRIWWDVIWNDRVYKYFAQFFHQNWSQLWHLWDFFWDVFRRFDNAPKDSLRWEANREIRFDCLVGEVLGLERWLGAWSSDFSHDRVRNPDPWDLQTPALMAIKDQFNQENCHICRQIIHP